MNDSISPSCERTGRGVHQRAHAPAVRDAHDYLLGLNRLTFSQQFGHRQILQGDLVPVGAPGSYDVQQQLGRLIRLSQHVREAYCLPVQGHRDSRCVFLTTHNEASRVLFPYPEVLATVPA